MQISPPPNDPIGPGFELIASVNNIFISLLESLNIFCGKYDHTLFDKTDNFKLDSNTIYFTINIPSLVKTPGIIDK